MRIAERSPSVCIPVHYRPKMSPKTMFRLEYVTALLRRISRKSRETAPSAFPPNSPFQNNN